MKKVEIKVQVERNVCQHPGGGHMGVKMVGISARAAFRKAKVLIAPQILGSKELIKLFFRDQKC